MLDINIIREQPELVKERLSVKYFKDTHLVDEIITIDQRRRTSQAAVDTAQAAMNKLSKAIGALYKSGDTAAAEEAKKETASLKEEIKTLNEQQRVLQSQLEEKLVQLPNLPHSSVPAGKTPEDNEIIRSHGDIPTLADGNQPHWELANTYDLFDLELGVKITGSGFPVYKNWGARLQRGLINFFLDEARNAGYTEYMPPLLVNEASAYATGQLPDKEAQMYEAKIDPFYLIPTAEVPLTNIYRDTILETKQFPVKISGHTPCFRREAGSYGKDVRGLNRVHQFEKVEIVQIQDPEESYNTLDQMVQHVEMLLQKLELPYRVLRLCGGDMSFTSALTFDLEVYSAAQEKWLEVSSVSNFETYQSNRLKIRYKGKAKKKGLVHTLNGSALALPRIMAALLENNQSAEGIKLPAAIQPYVGCAMITK